MATDLALSVCFLQLGVCILQKCPEYFVLLRLCAVVAWMHLSQKVQMLRTGIL